MLHTHTHIQYLSRGCERAVNIKKTERARVHSEVTHPVRLSLYAAVSLWTQSLCLPSKH